MAHRGTLFLDEIGDLPLLLQGKILRALEEKTFERVGGNAPLRVDVRVVAATNRNLKTAVAARQYRQDLYFRLSVFPIVVPPLRDRPGDIAKLARHFIDRYSRDLNKKPLALAPSALEQMQIRWPGNVRELQNCMERADPHRGRYDSRPPSQSLGGRRCGAEEAGVGPRRFFRHARRGRGCERVERRKIAAVLEQVDGDRPGGGRAPGQLQDADFSCGGTSSKIGAKTPPSERLLHFLLRHVVDDRRAADRNRQHEMQAATIFLSRFIASSISADDTSAPAAAVRGWQ
jgi:transcriptional regulator with GAF, ATPase, and Fis domain